MTTIEPGNGDLEESGQHPSETGERIVEPGDVEEPEPATHEATDDETEDDGGDG